MHYDSTAGYFADSVENIFGFFGIIFAEFIEKYLFKSSFLEPSLVLRDPLRAMYIGALTANEFKREIWTQTMIPL